jgi:hypothetical protein
MEGVIITEEQSQTLEAIRAGGVLAIGYAMVYFVVAVAFGDGADVWAVTIPAIVIFVALTTASEKGLLTTQRRRQLAWVLVIALAVVLALII